MRKTIKVSALVLAFVLMLAVSAVAFAETAEPVATAEVVMATETTAEATAEAVLLSATDEAISVGKEADPSPFFVVVLGLATVFVGLFALIIITKIMSWCYVAFSKKEKAVEAPAAAQTTVAGDVEDRKLLDAVIAATIATYMGTDVKGLRINSIKKI